jgi:hypothetical protein
MIINSYLLLLTVAHGAGGEVGKDGERGAVGVSGIEARRALAGRGRGRRHRRVPQEQVSAFRHWAEGCSYPLCRLAVQPENFKVGFHYKSKESGFQ